MKFLITLLFAIALFVVSCSDKSTDKKDKKVVACVTVDECDNGLLCINGFCAKEVVEPECVDNSECPNGFECNNGVCSQKTCQTKDDCGTGTICFTNYCITGCEDGSDCSDNKVCNTNTKKCEDDNRVDCRIENNCEQGYECDQLSGNCKINTTCNTDEECGADSTCIEHSCVPRTTCIPENNNVECSNGEICRPDGFCGTDNGCDNDDYCMNLDATKPACNTNSGICYECISDDYCTDGKVCDTDRYLCVDPTNLTCTTDEDCGLNRKCQEDGTCVSMFGAECNSDSDCTDLTQGKCLTSTDPHRCVQCLQDNQCETAQICNSNTYLCEDQGSGTTCQDDSECNTLAGESCVNNQCYNPNASGNSGADGICDMDYGGTLCLLFGGKCSGDAVDCLIRTGDLLCGDCAF